MWGGYYSFLPSWAHYKRAGLHRWNFLTQDGNRPSYQNVTFTISKDDERRPKQNMFTGAPQHYSICMSAHTASCLLTSELRQIWMVSFALHSLYSQEKNAGTRWIVGRFEARTILHMGGEFVPWGKQRVYCWHCLRRLIKSWMIRRNRQHAQKWIKCTDYPQKAINQSPDRPSLWWGWYEMGSSRNKKWRCGNRFI